MRPTRRKYSVRAIETPSCPGDHGCPSTVIEPVYDDVTGEIRYVSTPRVSETPSR